MKGLKLDPGWRSACVTWLYWLRLKSNPPTSERIAPVILADFARVAEAARAAVRAFETTRRMPSYHRRRLLKDITRNIVAAREELASLITRESGKPKTLARFEVDRARDLRTDAFDQLVHGVGHRDGVGAGLLLHRENDPALAVEPARLPIGLGVVHNRAQVAEPHGAAVPRHQPGGLARRRQRRPAGGAGDGGGILLGGRPGAADETRDIYGSHAGLSATVPATSSGPAPVARRIFPFRHGPFPAAAASDRAAA